MHISVASKNKGQGHSIFICCNMLHWLQGFKSKSELELKLKKASFRNDLIKYLEDVIKQGFLGDVGVNDDVNIRSIM